MILQIIQVKLKAGSVNLLTSFLAVLAVLASLQYGYVGGVVAAYFAARIKLPHRAAMWWRSCSSVALGAVTQSLGTDAPVGTARPTSPLGSGAKALALPKCVRPLAPEPVAGAFFVSGVLRPKDLR